MLIVLFALSCGGDSGNLLDNQRPGIAIIECTYDDEGIEVPSWTTGSTILAVVTFTDSVGTETDTLNVSDNLVTGEVMVRAASGYLVEVNCYNSAQELTWSGSTANVIIESDKESFISLILTTQLKKYTLSGTVTGTSGVTVFLTGDANDSLTVNDGESYSFTVLEKRNYTVTPTKAGYSFTPADITFDNLSSNQTHDFPAEQNTYTVSGTVSGTGEVSVTLSGDAAESQVVNDGGIYSFTVVEGGSYTVTPSKEGYGFSPEYLEFSDVISDETQDFRALLGNIEVTSSPAGAKIQLDGIDTGEITPYTFTDKPVGDYTVDVSLEDYSSDGPKDVTVSDGQTAQAAFSLTQLTGSIEVESTPAGAKILLDGIDTGKVTPITFTDIPVGEYTVDVSLEGYRSDGPKNVTVSDSQTAHVAFALTQLTGSIEVASTPPGAEILLDGIDTGEVTPFTFSDKPAVEYTVDVSLDGHTSDGPKTVTVSDGETAQASFTLTQLFGSIEVTSAPSGAKILLDGVDTGEVTPFTFSDKPAIEYTVDVSIDGYVSDGPKTVTVSDGETAQASFTLTPLFGSIEVTSAPSGAKILLDGVDTGEITPFTFSDKPAIEYTVDVSLDGYVSDGPKTVTVSDGETAQASFTLTPLFGSIEVTSAPAGAKILLDGVDTGTVTPSTISDKPVGEYTVDVSLGGYISDDPKTVQVADGQTAQVSFTLTQLKGSIEVTSTPSGAKILIGGVVTGKVTPSTISDKPVGEYTVDVALDGYTSDGPKTVMVSDGQKTAVDFILTQDWYTLSGKIVGADSVTVVLSGDAEGSRIVYDGESYSFIVPRGGSYTVSPAKDCYEFSPAGYTFENVISDMSQDFTSTQITYTISGAVAGADSVTVVLSGDASESLTVDEGGNYSITVACSGSYTVTASHPCYEITPADAVFDDLMADGTQDFSAAQIFVTISGTITGIDGVTVRLEGDATDSLLVDDGGSYSFTVACGSSYTVTPVTECYEFKPAVHLFNAIVENGGQDFSAALITFVLTGTITGSDYVMVTLGGDADEVQIVDDGDMYSFTVICGSNYSIIPSKPGHKFTPNYISYNNVKSDKNRNITVKPTRLPDGLVLALIPGGSFQMGSKDGL